MAETTEIAPEAGPLEIEEARGWVGLALDDADGTPCGEVRGLFVDSADGAPAWVLAVIERRSLLGLRREHILVAIPARNCAGAAGRAWAAHPRREMQTAPVVDPRRPLLREHEVTICAHYGIGPEVGRAAEVVGRPEGSVTAQPDRG